MKNILVVGAGNLGFRYIQGCLESNLVQKVFVFEINEKRVLELKNLLEASLTKLVFLDSLDKDLKSVDLIIVSTTSTSRVDLISNLIEKVGSPFWIIEKVLCQSISDLIKINDLFKENNLAWVNTFFRTVKMFEKVRSHFSADSPPKEINVYGSNWGLACNSIHFIDFAEWIFQNKVSFIDSSGLEPKWVAAKRDGFYEVFGKLVCDFDNGSKLIMDCSELGEESLVFDIKNEEYSWQVDWFTNSAVSSNGEVYDDGIPYQSIRTPLLIEELVNTGSCSLTTVSESVRQHELLIEAFLAHKSIVEKAKALHVPIT